MRRGEVWLVDLDPVEGHEQAQTEHPFRIEVKPPEGGLMTAS